MACYVFLGAGSAIAISLMKRLPTTDTVYALTRDASALDAADFECQMHIESVDAVDFSAVASSVSAISEKETVDAVVNFCGSVSLKPMHLLSPQSWQQTLDINLTTAFNLAHAVTTYIKKDCHIILFSTAAAHIGLPNHEAIVAAKSAVEGLSRSLAASYAKSNIRCNVIAPGLVETPLTESIVKSEQARAASLSMHGLNRLGQPQDIADCLYWLLNPATQWMTGEVIRIDGGLSTVKGFH